jgi:putative ABC transport system ATP-binding protein
MSTVEPRESPLDDTFVIEMEGVTKVYQMGSVAVHALRGVSLRVRSGEFLALMGQSGSGKSTLLHLLSCMDTPTQGTYRLEGRDVNVLSEDERALVRNSKVGIIFQDFNLLPRLNALENVALPLLYRVGMNGAEGQPEAALVRVGLVKRLHHRPSELSGGERQRVAIARALVTNPALILADEPTGNLDSVTGDEILGLLASLHSEGRTILMVTHSDSASAYAGRVIKLRDGQIVEQEGDDEAY